MSTAGKRCTNLDSDELDALIGSPARRYDEIIELWDTLLLKEDELAKAKVVLSAMKALVIFTVLPDSAAAAAEATRQLNRLFEHEGDLGYQRLRQHQRQSGIGASLAHLWNSRLGSTVCGTLKPQDAGYTKGFSMP
ncbi:MULTISPECIES: hypothetical protein [Nonomuraea]|uniref:Uncharacterized protein n=1 Tax=Nonomuraea ferruginea TaxID=46174 RepID=A0ABT4SWT7_9ACTN|nr:hypothetical protein [Nonomuraea ferruginea]MDA0641717.1 hypothetical protein [Nonomuraea ferruginea]